MCILGESVSAEGRAPAKAPSENMLALVQRPACRPVWLELKAGESTQERCVGVCVSVCLSGGSRKLIQVLEALPGLLCSE